MSAARSCCPYHLVLNCRQSRNYQDYSRCIFHYILQYLQVHVGGARSQDPHLHRQQDVREPSGFHPVYTAFRFPSGNSRWWPVHRLFSGLWYFASPEMHVFDGLQVHRFRWHRLLYLLSLKSWYGYNRRKQFRHPPVRKSCRYNSSRHNHDCGCWRDWLLQ